MKGAEEKARAAGCDESVTELGMARLARHAKLVLAAICKYSWMQSLRG
jgi:hypothetical protein